MLENFSPRLYQQAIFGTVAQKNTLVVLPTGLGKTALALMLSAHKLKTQQDKKILLLAPTKPLCEQHQQSFQKYLPSISQGCVLFTGSVAPAIRQQLWQRAKVIVSTPQGLENDILNQRINLEDLSALIFDEAHHATGEYSYVWIAKQFAKNNPSGRILALSASPGADREKIKEVCTNLSIEALELRTDKDPDVAPYVQETNKEWISLEFPAKFQAIRKQLETCKKRKLKAVQQFGYSKTSDLTKSQILLVQRELQRKISRGEQDFEVFSALSLLAQALKVEHMLGLLESQGLAPVASYVTEIKAKAKAGKVKAVQKLLIDPQFKEAVHLIESLVAQKIQHPKLAKMKELVASQLDEKAHSKIIIFTEFRDTAKAISEQLSSFSSHIFVGQSKAKGLGLTQKQQKQVLDSFRNGEFSILIATSVAEEGLDIPQVDRVIFYEPTPSAIRSIQRQGRTGRLEEGAVSILVTAKTRDEAYRWSAFHKERRMYKILEDLRRDAATFLNHETGERKEQTQLASFAAPDNKDANIIQSEEHILILADHREKGNKVIKFLHEQGFSLRTAQLDSADYVIAGKVGIERKSVQDFVDSLVDGRLLSQVKLLRDSFEKSLVIVEGEEEIYAVRNVHPNAIRAALTSIGLDFAVPVLYTKDSYDTSQLLAQIAKRESSDPTKRSISLHSHKEAHLKGQQEYLVSALPSIGKETAIRLLEHFSSVQALANASTKDLEKIKGIGKVLAQKIVNVFTSQYIGKD